LVFRIPVSASEATDDLYAAWRERRGGLLIYSLPGDGKTSALRGLVGKVSKESGLRVAVIDERREFIPDDYTDTTVDILSGYSKERGLEIALRTLSPEVIVIDEIGSLDEAEALLRVGRGGVPIIASSHAGSFEEVVRKASIAPLVEEGYFKIYARLYRKDGKFMRDISVVGG
jgi:stage III sporulation protein AA